MRIHLGTDHAGLEFAKTLASHLAGAGHEVLDHGPTEYDALDDYPSFCINAAHAVVADRSRAPSSPWTSPRCTSRPVVP